MIVVYNRPNVHFAYGIKLIPGANHIDPRLWEIAKKDQEIQHFIKNGVLTLPEADDKSKNPESTVTTLTEEERQKMEAKAFGDNREGINPNAPAEDLSELEPLTRFNEKKALGIVAETFKVDILQAWLTTETRFKVKRAIEEQILKMDKVGTPEQTQEA